MRNSIFLILIIALLVAVGCKRLPKEFHESLAGSDSVVINFFRGDGTMDTVVAVKIIRDKAAIENLTAFITAVPASVKNNCGYDGSIHYFKNNMVIQDVDFRMQKDDCTQFTFILEGKKEATSLSINAGAFLTTLKK
ncbi:MAG: hypothetical protein IPP72_04580 [Chitinophagaceae bacterium]|nr:hypothetical protein [Chitinophagaceae bacterium]